MAKIICPNKEYTGVSATVAFAAGVGYTDNPNLIKWFKCHGYKVEEELAEKPKQPEPFEDMTDDEIREYAKQNGVDLGNATARKTIIKKILDAGVTVPEVKPAGEGGSDESNQGGN